MPRPSCWWLSLAKIPIFSRHWTSLFAPATVGMMIYPALTFIFSTASWLMNLPMAVHVQ